MIARLFRLLLQIIHFPAAVFVALMSVMAALGFAHPLLDALNHVQPVWFTTTFVALILAGFLYRNAMIRAFMVALSATGFLASSIMIVPEAAAGFLANPPASSAAGRTYTLLSYNVFGMNYDEARVIKLVESVSPDVIALQEYFGEQRVPLHPYLAKNFQYFAYCVGGKRENLAIYAKVPFDTLDTDVCKKDEGNRTVRLSLHFKPTDGSAFTLVTTQNDWPIQVSPLIEARGMPRDPSRLWGRQQAQFASLSSLLQNIEGPLLVAGDFNSTSWSYALREFTFGNRLTRHTRNLATFPKLFDLFGWRETFAFLPLDHVFSRAGIIVHDVHTEMAAGSDHLPVVTVFSIAD